MHKLAPFGQLGLQVDQRDRRHLMHGSAAPGSHAFSSTLPTSLKIGITANPITPVAYNTMARVTACLTASFSRRNSSFCLAGSAIAMMT